MEYEEETYDAESSLWYGDVGAEGLVFVYERLALLMLRIDGGRSGIRRERIDFSKLAVRGREKEIGRGLAEMGGRAVTSGGVVARGISG